MTIHPSAFYHQSLHYHIKSFLSPKKVTIQTFAESLKKQPLMAYQSRTRKRVNALRRAPDGSAFQTWYSSPFLSISMTLFIYI